MLKKSRDTATLSNSLLSAYNTGDGNTRWLQLLFLAYTVGQMICEHGTNARLCPTLVSIRILLCPTVNYDVCRLEGLSQYQIYTVQYVIEIEDIQYNTKEYTIPGVRKWKSV